MEGRRLDVAITAMHAIWPDATAIRIYRERLVVALPERHSLAKCETLSWADLRDEAILVQGWDECQTAREFCASFLGSGARFRAHAISNLGLFALVGAGFGVAITTTSQSEIVLPRVVFKPINDPAAWVQIALAWMPDLEHPSVGRFVAFIRDETRFRSLL